MNRKMVYVIWVICLLLAGQQLTMAQAVSNMSSGSKTMSLADAQLFAVQNSYNVRNAKLDVLLADEKVWETTTIGLPQISAKIQYQNIFTVPTMSFGPALVINDGNKNNPINTAADIGKLYQQTPPIALGVKQNATLDLTVTQLVFSGEYIVGLQAAKIYRNISDQSLKKTEEDTKLTVTKTYYLVLVAEESRTILDSSYQLIAKTAKEMEEMNRQGFVEETDVDQIHLTEANIKNTLSNVTRQVELAKRLLKFQIGMNLSDEIVLTDRLEAIINSMQLQAVGNFSYDGTNTIDFQIVETAEKLNELSLKREQSKFLPTVAAFYRHQEQWDEPAFNFNPPDVLGVSIDIPLFSSGMRISRVSQAKMNLDKSRIQKQQAQQGIILDFEQTKTEFAGALDKYTTTKDNFQLARKIYNKTLVKYHEGVSSSLELITVQNQYLTSQSNYFNAISELLGSKAKLDKLLMVYKK